MVGQFQARELIFVKGMCEPCCAWTAVLVQRFTYVAERVAKEHCSINCL